MLKPYTSVIIAAGGKSKRMGRQKQLIKLHDKPVLFYSIETFLKVPQVKEIIIVTDDKVKKICEENFKSKKIKYAAPGSTRIKSVINGVNIISKNSKLIAVHDGARPLVTKKTILKCLTVAVKTGASVASTPVKDTIKISKNGKNIDRTLDRETLWSAQTPQCYKTAALKKALIKFSKQKDATDESQLVEKTGVKVTIVKSEYENLKITTPKDIVAASAYTADRKKRQGTGLNIRSGLGYDIHRMIEGRPFIIGGVEIPHTKGLLGHSDGDVILHSVCDAVLGALAAGEIGIFFPPTDLTLMGISSVVIAEKTLEIMKSKKAEIVQLDIIFIAEEPKIFPHYSVIKKSLSEIFETDIANINLKAKTQEGLGAIGKGNAAACQTLAVVRYK